MNIVLIAHESKKKLMQNFCIAYRLTMSKHTLLATETTGRLVEEVTNLNIQKFLAGHLGGVEQLVQQVDQNLVDMVIYLRDPHTTKKEPDVTNIFLACDRNNIPLATNVATAEMLIKGLERGDLEWRDVYK